MLKTILRSSFVYTFTVLIAFNFTAKSYAAVIELENGDRISGTFLSMENSHLKMETLFGVVDIPITSITFMKGSETEETLPQNVLTAIENNSSDAQSNDTLQAAERNPEQKPEDNKGLWGAEWKGNANFGIAIQNGNSETEAYNSDASVSARWEKHRASAKADFKREDDDGNKTVDNQSLDLAYDYFFREKWFWNNKLSLKRDDIEDLELRTTYGMGIGHQLFEQDDLNLQFILGLSYLHENFVTDDTDESLAYQWQFDYDQKLWDKYLTVFHNHDLTVPSDASDAFLFDSSSGLRIPLKAGIIATAGVDFDWDNDPIAGTTEEDVTYSIKLGYEWGN